MILTVRFLKRAFKKPVNTIIFTVITWFFFIFHFNRKALSRQGFVLLLGWIQRPLTPLLSVRHVVPPGPRGHIQGGLESAGKPQASDPATRQSGVHSGLHQDHTAQPGPGADGEDHQPGENKGAVLQKRVTLSFRHYSRQSGHVWASCD